MKTRFVTTLLLSIILCACDDDAGEYPGPCEYEPETVLIGTKSEVTLDKAFDMINGDNLGIRQISGVKYVSAIGTDSIDYVIQQLNKKSYINAHGFSAVNGGSVYVHYLTGELTVLTHLWDMTLANQQDWRETMIKLRLTETPTEISFNLKVPPETEKLWVYEFLERESIKYAELNCYFVYGPS